ncbi:hypothetical protein [Hyalangium rubrum]|uniref:Uncharacterized protein n=1 Tax=Hyalangium rubrum TaxID=3103134 RepID=A0ABU5H950_9BACT|nr:hypothetical protein [Hyalangium sp. s54d21]MDY7229841.1 hypothetical protein [Hyalangium sp. s54d21]
MADVLRERWRTPNVTRNGRNGQKQYGVDIYGSAAHLPHGGLAGAQCKNTDTLSFAVVEECVSDAEAFEPKIAELLVCTTAPRDANVQREVRLLDQKRAQAGQFRVHLLCWEDLSLELAGHPRLLAKHFPAWSRLDGQDEQPSLSLLWDFNGSATNAVLLDAVPRRLLDLRAAAVPFSEAELAKGDLSPDEVERANLYNAAVENMLQEEANKERWRKHKAQERYERFGVKVGVRLENDRALAEDVVGTMMFPQEFEIWAAGEQPQRHEGVKFPARPNIGAARRIAEKLALMDPLRGRKFPAIAFPMAGPIHVRLVPDWARLRVSGSEVSFSVDRIAPRRVLTLSDEDAITIVPPDRPGEYEVKWRVDAENLRGPTEGVLKLVVR